MSALAATSGSFAATVPAHNTGRGRWRKRKGVATVRLGDGTIRLAELHWYEATGIGRKELKLKRYLD